MLLDTDMQISSLLLMHQLMRSCSVNNVRRSNQASLNCQDGRRLERQMTAVPAMTVADGWKNPPGTPCGARRGETVRRRRGALGCTRKVGGSNPSPATPADAHGQDPTWASLPSARVVPVTPLHGSAG